MEVKMSDLKDKVKEIAEIAASLPDNLQQPCFELLLKHYLASVLPASGSAEDVAVMEHAVAAQEGVPPAAPPETLQPLEQVAKGQADLTNNDLHVKARRFMEKYSVSLAELNNLFYKEGQEVMPLYEDLKTTRTAESQIRVALLLSLRSALTGGEFQVTVEAVRTECRDRKCYDAGNFAANFNNNRSLFDFEKYTKNTIELRLSENGRRELAQLIKELQ
jgi:hypothetical protein